MHLMLINTGNDAGIAGNANENSFPPLNIISLATSITKTHGHYLETTLLDGQVDSQEEILTEIRSKRPDIVGVSIYLTSIRNSIEIIREAKNLGAKTILGNDHASMHCKLLMEKIPEIDFICLNDVGEESLQSILDHLLHKQSIDEAVKICFRTSNGAIKVSKGKSRFVGGSSLDAIEIPNRNLLSMKYWETYKTRFHNQKRKCAEFSGKEFVTTINRARGCAQKKVPCRYCGILDLTLRHSSSEIFWEDVKAAREQIGATILYEAWDSASSHKKVLADWLNNRPDELHDSQFKMYVQAFESDKELINILSDLNVFCVNMGLDSGDNELLKLLKGPRHSLESNINACTEYSDKGIEIYTSFVLTGLGNELKTRISLDKTLAFAEWLATNTSTVSFDSAALYPDKTAPIGGLIWKPEEADRIAKELGWTFIDIDILKKISDKWINEIYLDPTEISADFARACGISYSVLEEYSNELSKLSSLNNMNFGRSQSGEM